MVEYTKPWLSVEQQIDRLASRGVDVGDRDHAAEVLRAVGYYRLTGYLYPFRQSEQYVDETGRARTKVLSGFRPDTRLDHAEERPVRIGPDEWSHSCRDSLRRTR